MPEKAGGPRGRSWDSEKKAQVAQGRASAAQKDPFQTVKAARERTPRVVCKSAIALPWRLYGPTALSRK